MFQILIEKAKKHFGDLKPFVLYRKPLEQNVIGLFQNDDALHYVQDYTTNGFIFAPFNSDEPTILFRIDEKLIVEYNGIKKFQGATENNFELATVEKAFHINLVEKGIEAIKNDAFKKVVLSRKIEVSIKKSPFELFQELLANYNNAFCYVWYHPKIGLWLGATPEILLRTENAQLKTMSLAGTQKYTGTETPKWGTKELEEQALVTSYITNAIQSEVNQLKISDTTSVRAGDLWHLRTSVTGIMKSNTIPKIVNALHPTPAVCGLPKKETKAFILNNENYNREYYTGFLGELNFKEELLRAGNKRNKENQVYKTIKNTSSLYVNLRCMQIKKDKAYIYVGGGITKDSNPIKEWEETVAKSKTMLKVLLA